METIKVKVTQEHIDKGLPCKAFFCPVSLAVVEAFDKYGIKHSASTTGRTIETNSKAGYIEYICPQEVVNFVDNFDLQGPKGEDIKPFEFELGENDIMEINLNKKGRIYGHEIGD